MAVRVLCLVVGIGLWVGKSGWAQSDKEEVSISAAAQPSEVGTEGIVIFKIQVRGAPLSAIEPPDASRTANLVLQQSTPVTQRELSFDSGRLQRRVTLSWRYKPMRVGIGRIRSTTLRVKGERYETEEVRVRILSQSQTPSRGQAPHKPTAASESNDSRSELGLEPRDLFIRATASADTVYQNEQMTASYRLFFRPGIQLRRSRMADAWEASGFWREELDVDSRPTPQRTTLDGTTYETIVLKRVALFPARTGPLAVDPLRIETEARAQPELGRKNEALPRSQFEPVTLASEELTIQALPLPSGAPTAFDGAVGQFALRAGASADRAQVGEGITLTAEITGTGNLSTVSPPLVAPPSEIEVYDPSVETKIERSGAEIRGTKTFRYTLVPGAKGTYSLPPIEFAYFNPEMEQYETVQAGDTTLRVTGEAAPQAQSQTANGLPIGDVAGPMEGASRWVRTDRAPLYAQFWVYAVVVLPILLAVAGVAWRRRRQPEPSSPPESDVLADAEERLETADQHRREGEVRAFYRTVERAVLTFLEHRLDLPRAVSRMTASDLDQHLEQHDTPASHRKALRTLLDACNQFQFTPARPTDDDMADARKQAQTLLRRLDTHLPARSPSAS